MSEGVKRYNDGRVPVWRALMALRIHYLIGPSQAEERSETLVAQNAAYLFSRSAHRADRLRPRLPNVAE